ncbi:MAG: GDSL-like Lipase/Acylhydrolase [candidate division WS6 bacterium OLB20]|uniref:GDSL-like Lipase/Acylhydrolase n=1 Tax=candidate division WS6 bacterium OLB20 TaxID=1617426 RepID=A0A136LWX4_9BACT|nr:MAG: GDSL-like Lipase/Acylhydrolase [candidate division WS6 bacterium OLB20]
MSFSKDPIAYVQNKLDSDARFTIVCLGDSITSTEWVHPNWREVVEYVLKEELMTDESWKQASWGIRFINSGYDGATVQDLLDRFDTAVGQHKPDLVIYVASSNDRHDGITPEESGRLNDLLLSMIQETGARTIFCTSTSSYNITYNSKIKEYNREYEDLKADSRIDLFRKLQAFDLQGFYTFASSGNAVEGIKPGETDYMHPNVKGNIYVAKIILEEGFGISFDAERYLNDLAAGVMMPRY